MSGYYVDVDSPSPSTRDFHALYRQNREDFDKLVRQLAAERRENYRTKGTYF
ncbi:MAG: hypothetical protein ACP5DY_07930 [Thermovirgaceae bacterium]